jgi:uncharacterized protein (TIGR02611 family)
VVGLQAFLRWVGRSCRRLAVTLGGAILLVTGIIGLALPILPGWICIIGGLSLLGTEYAWARRMCDWAKRQAVRARDGVKNRRSRRRRIRPVNPEQRPAGSRPANQRPEEGPRYRRTG